MAQNFKLRIPPSEFAKYNRRTKRLVDRVKTKVVKKSLQDAMRPMVPLMREAAPRGKTGMLKRSIKMKTVTYKRNDFVDVIVGVSNLEKEVGGKKVRPSRYAHLVELGTGAANANGKGSAPKPFVRPIKDQHEPSIKATARANLKRGIEEVARTL